MKDLVRHGDRVVAVKGGKGGKGNVHFKNSVRQAPNFCGSRRRCQRARYRSELKLIADVGLLGFPNVESPLFFVGIHQRKAEDRELSFHDDYAKFGGGSPLRYQLCHGGYPDWWRARMKAPVSVWIFSQACGTDEGSHSCSRYRRFGGRDPIEDFDKINGELMKYSEKGAPKAADCGGGISRISSMIRKRRTNSAGMWRAKVIRFS